MGGLDHGIAFPGQSFYGLHDPKLVAVVQAGRGLVHYQNFCLLGDSPGDEGKLPFATADIAAAPVAKMGNTDSFHGSFCQFFLLLSGGSKAAKLSGGAHEHHVKDAEIEHRAVGLGDICHSVGQFRRRHAADIPSADVNTAAGRLQQTQHTLKEGTFACTVGTQQRNKAAVLYAEGNTF